MSSRITKLFAASAIAVAAGIFAAPAASAATSPDPAQAAPIWGSVEVCVGVGSAEVCL